MINSDVVFVIICHTESDICKLVCKVKQEQNVETDNRND